jgi:hypothetical protein
MQHATPRPATMVAAALCAMAILAPLPAGAHHGWSGYADEDSQLTGVVETPVSLAGPHATMKLRVGEQVWDITLGPPARTARAGLQEGILPVGAQVTVYGHRHRNPNRLEMKTERVVWGQRVFDVYPNRH